MTEEEFELKIAGPLEDANPYLEKMINYWRKTQKNLYSFLLTLSNDELVNFTLALMSEEEKKEIEVEAEVEEKWAQIGRSLAIMAHTMERGRDGKPFEATIDELCQAGHAFAVASGLALHEKMGLMKITDDSYFFDIDCTLKIEYIKDLRK